MFWKWNSCCAGFGFLSSQGRAGGADRSVLGAHTLGFNTDASAIAVIGTYDGAGVSKAVQTVIARGLVDKDRLVLMGWSAGGTLVDKLITMTDRFKGSHPFMLSLDAVNISQ